jgi:opacity protein-like surface antigen
MKKTIILAFIAMFFGSFANADIGLNIGVSAQLGEITATGEERNSDSQTNAADGVGTQKTDESALFGTAGFFLEKDLSFLPGRAGEIGSRISLGYDNIVHDISLGTSNNVRNESLGAGGAKVPAGSNKLEADVTGFETIYAQINITDWLYVKAGEVTVDVSTIFTKNGVKSTDYGSSHELSGNVYGFGVQHTADNGLFFRLEYNNYDIDGKSVTSAGADSTLTAELKDVSGDTGRISIGKAF